MHYHSILLGDRVQVYTGDAPLGFAEQTLFGRLRLRSRPGCLELICTLLLQSLPLFSPRRIGRDGADGLGEES